MYEVKRGRQSCCYLLVDNLESVLDGLVLLSEVKGLAR